jgi:hypothetical protein
MTVYIWRVLFIVSIVLFVGLIVLSCVLGLLKNKYYHQYEQNELIKTTKTVNSKNDLYFTSGETRHFIKKYVVCRTAFDKYLVCNFAEKYERIVYFVIQYTKRKRVISVMRIEEKNTADSSKVIALKKNCSHVNVIIGTVGRRVINENVIRPLSLRRIRLHALIRCSKIYLFLFIVRQLVIEILAGNYIKLYLVSALNYIAVILPAILLVISYFITVKCLRRRNVRALTGGALEYEFI